MMFTIMDDIARNRVYYRWQNENESVCVWMFDEKMFTHIPNICAFFGVYKHIAMC